MHPAIYCVAGVCYLVRERSRERRRNQGRPHRARFGQTRSFTAQPTVPVEPTQNFFTGYMEPVTAARAPSVAPGYTAGPPGTAEGTVLVCTKWSYDGTKCLEYGVEIT